MRRKVDKAERIGVIATNISGLKMKCIEYYNSSNISVEFENGYVIHNVQWNNFVRGKVKDKSKKDSKIIKSGKLSKEYYTWIHMLDRCFNEKIKEQKPTYKDCICCDEWLIFDNFCSWLHEQENFSIWQNLKWSAIDKDILVKGNKIYSPETCCLVPINVNSLFVKQDTNRGNLPIGVFLRNDKYKAYCANPLLNKKAILIGSYDNQEDAFLCYKQYKENLIKQIADIEYNNQTITKECRDAMYAYKVEIDD
jgi:hypothetical protein